MSLEILEKKIKWSNGETSFEESTQKCWLCRVLFPIEYGDCPGCNMLR